ncbi:MAG TPA: hypothetical protein VLL82_16460 [Mycobacterium sp.]|nr:hypothetical protein [Mycobacterium sp.]
MIQLSQLLRRPVIAKSGNTVALPVIVATVLAAAAAGLAGPAHADADADETTPPTAPFPGSAAHPPATQRRRW